jgi:hypothetical protein
VAGVLCYGVEQTTLRWEKDVKLPSWFSVAGNVLGIALASGLGALVGMMLWNWELGLICGVVGGFSSNWIVSVLASRFENKK